MTDAQGAEGVVALSQLVEQSFPDLRCLRCGNKDFHVLPSEERRYVVNAQTEQARVVNLNFIPLICTRCGMVEQHVAETLAGATKPIDVESSGGG